MSHQKKPVNTMESHHHPLDDGLNPEKLNLSEHPVGTLDIGSTIQMSHSSSIQHQLDKKLSMHESLPINNETTCNDKLNICLKNSQTPKWKRKLDQDLDLIGEVFKESLNSSVWDKYPLLLSHIKTGLVGLDSTCVKNTTQLSWLTIQTLNSKPQMKSSSKTCLPSHTPLAVECMGIENSTLKQPKIKNKNDLNQNLYASARVDILKLTPEQKQYFSTLSFGYNTVYNRGVRVLKHQVDNNIELDPYKLRDVILRNFDNFKYTEKQTKFLKSMPYRVKEKAAENISSILKATKTNWTQCRYNKRKKPKKRKPKKDNRPQCTYIFKTGVNKGNKCTVKMCKKHTPKIICDIDGCKCRVVNGFKKCKTHVEECIYTNTTGTKCKNTIARPGIEMCFKHDRQPTCKYDNCNTITKYDYCLNHAIKLNIKIKYRNRKSNKIITLNERDWDTLIRRIKRFKRGYH